MRHHAPQSAKAGRESVDERLVAEAQRDAMSSEEAPSPAVWIMVVTLLPVSVAVVALFDAGNLPLMITSVIVPLAGLVAYRFPFVAGVAAAGAFVLAASGPRFEPNALLPIGAGLGMLIWQLTRLPQPAARVPLLIVFAGALLLGGQFGRQGIGFVVALSAIAFGAALAWKERDEILHSEQSRSVRLMAGIAAATLRAERAERMLLARELHDGVSHGITAMSLQASAAHALGATNLARAQHSMAAVREVGERTLREIDALAQGRSDDDARTAMSLDSLIEGARATGLNIAHRPVGDADRLSYRIVQEALTNITRYAPGARVVIETGDVGAQRFVRVVDSGAVLVGASLNGTQRALENLGHGRGLIGLAERVAERDDRFRAGPLDAGFEVYAHWHHAVDEPQNAWIERQQETET